MENKLPWWKITLIVIGALLFAGASFWLIASAIKMKNESDLKKLADLDPKNAIVINCLNSADQAVVSGMEIFCNSTNWNDCGKTYKWTAESVVSFVQKFDASLIDENGPKQILVQYEIQKNECKALKTEN